MIGVVCSLRQLAGDIFVKDAAAHRRDEISMRASYVRALTRVLMDHACKLSRTDVIIIATAALKF